MRPATITVTCVIFATVVCVLLVPAGAVAARATVVPRIAPHQETVTLLVAKSVRTGPTGAGTPVALVSARRPLTGARTVLPMLAQVQDDRGGFWLRVRLPGRALTGKTPPRAGWISASSTLRSTTPWHIVVNVGARRVLVYRDGRRMRSYPAIVGTPSTPTPRGDYFVEENVKLSAGRAGAPFALALSARSSVFQEFEGGPGQIALHGLSNIGGQLGTAVSHGCVRLADGTVAWLAARIKPGAPVTIT
jgi:lipoprotein-anchoring transpeptidase ErfK/SrfK